MFIIRLLHYCGNKTLFRILFIYLYNFKPLLIQRNFLSSYNSAIRRTDINAYRAAKESGMFISTFCRKRQPPIYR